MDGKRHGKAQAHECGTVTRAKWEAAAAAQLAVAAHGTPETTIRTGHEWFDQLPPAARHGVMDEVAKAIKWSGWDRDCSSHAAEHIRNIIAILAQNGHEVETYT